MTLNPPDRSRGHSPIMGLFLANPGARLTRDDVWEALRSVFVTPHLGNLVRTGNLIKDGEHYVAPTPFPPSAKERDRSRKKAVRHARGLKRPPREPHYPTNPIDSGEVSEEARKARQQTTTTSRLTGRAKIQAKVLDLLNADRDREWLEKELLPLIGGSPIHSREALIDLIQNGKVHATVTRRDKGSVYIYRAVQVPDRSRAPAAITPQHAQIHAIVTRERAITRDNLLTRLERVTKQPADTLAPLVTDLFHAGHLTFKPVCATVVIQPGPTPLPATTTTPMPVQEADAA